jgi:hypothetical protein
MFTDRSDRHSKDDVMPDDEKDQNAESDPESPKTGGSENERNMHESGSELVDGFKQIGT